MKTEGETRMEMPKISVIVPIYNCKEYVSRCVDSLLGSTHPNMEIILINDGSTDGVEELLLGYEGRENVIIIHQENGGVASARNRGLDIASGEYIGFLDADDFVDKDMYSTLLGMAIERDADIVQCAMLCTTESGEVSISCAPTKELVIDKPEVKTGELFNHFCYGCCCKLYRKELVSDIRFDTRFPIGEDLMFNLLALSGSPRVVLCPSALYYYTQRNDSATHTAVSGEKLLSFRNMLKQAEVDVPSLGKYILTCKLNNNTDIISKIILGEIDGQEKAIDEIREECRRNAMFILFGSALPFGQKIKLLGIGFFFCIYSKMLKRKKGGA